MQWHKVSKDILENAKKAEKIILASDPDREGEAIAWHIEEILKIHKIKAPCSRIVFHSITKESILKALENETGLRTGLVNAYLARTGLDYMFGFGISPVLWRKVSCCKSAGRVQSVALRLIVEKEYEILTFEKKKYKTIHANFKNIDIHALMIELNSEKLDQGQIYHDIDVAKLNFNYKISSVEKKQTKIAPYAPLITSTLQQAAYSKLNFSLKYTMQLAQKLYEGFTINGKHQGLITYMRTDSITIIPEEIENIRNKISKVFGKDYVSNSVITHKSKVKNAQEAHEAIRPVDINLLPNQLDIEKDLVSLYNLIWQRTMASQASDCINENLTIKIDATSHSDNAVFEIKNTVNLFLGFKKILDEEDDNKDKNFKIKEEQELILEELYEKEHETQPPKRFNEASIVKQFIKQGIGRPSTYAHIIEILYKREYIENVKKTIQPSVLGWLVISFLKHYFTAEVEYDFTSQMEDNLDAISNNEGEYIALLKDFSQSLDEKIKFSMTQDVRTVSKIIESVYEKYFDKDNNKCPACNGELLLKVTKIGCLRGCSNYPECNHIVKFDQKNISQDQVNNAQVLGVVDQETIELKVGIYGPYVQNSIKKVSIPKAYHNKLEEINLEKAMLLLSLPKKLGEHESLPVTLKIGKFGPYIEYNKKFFSAKNIFEVTLENAIALITK